MNKNGELIPQYRLRFVQPPNNCFFSPHIAPLPPIFSPTVPTSRQGTAQSKSETTDKSNIRQNYPPKHFDYRAVSRNFAVMNELSPYLRKLLLEHDCAIIPDFGGFVMQRHAARHATADQQMLPPLKTVGFNALLRTEDGLLAHEVCKSRHISYAQAADFVQQCVRDMKRDLMRGLEVKFDGVGCIQLSTDGNYDFSPEPQINLTPEYYFLTPFALKEIPKTEEVKSAETSLTPDGATAERGNSLTRTTIHHSGCSPFFPHGLSRFRRHVCHRLVLLLVHSPEPQQPVPEH